jgi:hypothetical protein
VQLEFAHRLRAALGASLTVIDAADHRLLRGPAFYDLFIDRSRWPALIREGYERTTRTLEGLRHAPKRALAGANGRSATGRSAAGASVGRARGPRQRGRGVDAPRGS